MDYKTIIRGIPDFPKKGILFRDITPLMSDPVIFASLLKDLKKTALTFQSDCIAAIESRGFLIGAPLASQLGLPLVLIRKQGKLPGETEKVTYDLEYGQDTLEIHSDAICKDQRVLLVDDLLATGGTLLASAKLIEKLGGTVSGVTVLIELSDLEGRAKLGDLEVAALVRY